MTWSARVVLIVAVTALALTMVLCAAFAWVDVHRVELFHFAYFNACSIHAYQYHWQNAARLRENFRYDFTLSPISFVLVEVWVIDGPILKFSQRVPIEC